MKTIHQVPQDPSIDWLLDADHPDRRKQWIDRLPMSGEEFLSVATELLEVERSDLYYNDPQAYISAIEESEQEIASGFIGILIGAIFTGFTSGFWIGVLSLVVGAVQYFLTQSQQPRQRDPDQKFAANFGGDSVGDRARFGQTIPAIFCNNELDATGGVQVGGDLVFSAISVVNGNEEASARFVLGHGEIGNVDLSRTLINGAPFGDGFPGIELSWQAGTAGQQAVPGYNFYCQNVQALNNNTIGLGLITESASVGTPSAPGGFRVNNIAAFAVGSTYTLVNSTASTNFVVNSLDIPNSTIFTNTALPGLAGGQTIAGSLNTGRRWRLIRLDGAEPGVGQDVRVGGEGEFTIASWDSATKIASFRPRQTFGSNNFTLGGQTLIDTYPNAPVGTEIQKYGGIFTPGYLWRVVERIDASPVPIAQTVGALSSGSTSFTVSETQFQSYSTGSRYLATKDSTKTIFRIIDKVKIGNTYSIVTDRILPPGTGQKIYIYNQAEYRTSKRVNRIDINFQLSINARNSEGSLIEYAQIYTLYIKKYSDSVYQKRCVFFFRSINPATLYAAISISELKLDTYQIKIEPEPFVGIQTVPIIELRNDGVFNSFAFQSSIAQGANGFVVYQGAPANINSSSIEALANQAPSRISSSSSQQGVTAKIQHLNEIELNSNPLRDITFKGLATVEVRIKFNAQINGRLDLIFFVTKGIKTHKLISAGTADNGSGGSALRFIVPRPFVFQPGLILRNLSKRIESKLIGGFPDVLTTENSLNWEEGDRWLLKGTHSSCWLPEIRSWLAFDPRFGASEAVIADYSMDYPTLVENTRWVEGNNQYNQSFAWHGFLNKAEELQVWNSREARDCMLQPSEATGRSAYEPYRTPINMPNPVIYNSANAEDVRIDYTTLALNPLTSVSVVYRELEQVFASENTLSFNEQEVTVETWALRRDQAPRNSQTFRILSCTSRKQAVLVAKLKLNLGRYGGHIAASLKAISIEAVYARVGYAFRLQTSNTNYRKEQCGIVVETLPGGKFRLDRDFTLIDSRTTSPNPTGLTDQLMDFFMAGVQVGDIVRNIENGVTSIVTSVAQRALGCSPPVPSDTYYEVGDITVADLVLVKQGASSLAINSFTAEYLNGHIWLTSAPGAVVADVVAIGTRGDFDRYFQCLAAEVVIGGKDPAKQSFSVAVVGSNWSPDFYKFDDLTVTDRDGSTNLPA